MATTALSVSRHSTGSYAFERRLMSVDRIFFPRGDAPMMQETQELEHIVFYRSDTNTYLFNNALYLNECTKLQKIHKPYSAEAQKETYRLTEVAIAIGVRMRIRVMRGVPFRSWRETLLDSRFPWNFRKLIRHDKSLRKMQAQLSGITETRKMRRIRIQLDQEMTAALASYFVDVPKEAEVYRKCLSF